MRTSVVKDMEASFARFRVPRPAAFLAAAILALAFTLVAVGAPSAPPPARIAAGFAHSCAVTSGGGVKCWGGNPYGAIGNGGGPLATAFSPVDVKGLRSGVRAIAAGGQHTCALTSPGKVKCWGDNRLGQLGSRSTPNGRTPVPVEVAGLTSGVTAIAAGYAHSCALMRGGGVKCWGWNYGRLGNGSRDEFRTKPVDVRR